MRFINWLLTYLLGPKRHSAMNKVINTKILKAIYAKHIFITQARNIKYAGQVASRLNALHTTKFLGGLAPECDDQGYFP